MRCTAGAGGGPSGCRLPRGLSPCASSLVGARACAARAPSSLLCDRLVTRGLLHDRQRQQLAAGGADLDGRVHLRADAAVEARGPAAVLDLGLVERVLP